MTTSHIGLQAIETEQSEWLDKEQALQRLPGVSTWLFYTLAKQISSTRPVRKERRLINSNPPRFRPVLVWSAEEVKEIGRLVDAWTPRQRAKTAVEPVAPAPVPETPFLTNMDMLILSLNEVVEALVIEARRDRDAWQRKYEQAVLERDEARAQLQRIKSALGV